MTRNSNENNSSIPIVGHLINGKVVHREGIIHDVYNPSLGLVEKKLQLANHQTVLDAVNSGKKAFPEWRNTPPIKRARIMFNFLKLLEKNSDQICDLIGKEHYVAWRDTRSSNEKK